LKKCLPVYAIMSAGTADKIPAEKFSAKTILSAPIAYLHGVLIYLGQKAAFSHYKNNLCKSHQQRLYSYLGSESFFIYKLKNSLLNREFYNIQFHNQNYPTFIISTLVIDCRCPNFTLYLFLGLCLIPQTFLSFS